MVWLTTAPVVAQQTTPRAAPPAAAEAARAVVAGSVVDQDRAPLPDAQVRVRNLRTSRIDQTAAANHKGEFRFLVDSDTPYVIELVDSEARIVSISDVITLNKGEVSGILLTGTSRASLAQFFGNTTGAVAAALSGFGLTSLHAAPPLSPEK